VAPVGVAAAWNGAAGWGFLISGIPLRTAGVPHANLSDEVSLRHGFSRWPFTTMMLNRMTSDPTDWSHPILSPRITAPQKTPIGGRRNVTAPSAGRTVVEISVGGGSGGGAGVAAEDGMAAPNADTITNTNNTISTQTCLPIVGSSFRDIRSKNESSQGLADHRGVPALIYSRPTALTWPPRTASS
jgi:hypothetical protein